PQEDSRLIAVASANDTAACPDGNEAWPENGRGSSLSCVSEGRGRPTISLSVRAQAPAAHVETPMRTIDPAASGRPLARATSQLAASAGSTYAPLPNGCTERARVRSAGEWDASDSRASHSSRGATIATAPTATTANIASRRSKGGAGARAPAAWNAGPTAALESAGPEAAARDGHAGRATARKASGTKRNRLRGRPSQLLNRTNRIPLWMLFGLLAVYG